VAEITSPRELFIHELGDILYVEEHLVNEVLPQAIREAQHDELRTVLERHLDETRGHVENVEHVFETLGESPRTEQCIGFEGLKHEKEQLSGKVSESLMDAVIAGAAGRVEHYEIAAYSGLVEKARALGEQDAVNLLDANLKEDKEAMRQVESVEKTLRDEMKAATR
jgi:ferritin-like metal-binding protein YciE